MDLGGGRYQRFLQSETGVKKLHLLIESLCKGEHREIGNHQKLRLFLCSDLVNDVVSWHFSETTVYQFVLVRDPFFKVILPTVYTQISDIIPSFTH